MSPGAAILTGSSSLFEWAGAYRTANFSVGGGVVRGGACPRFGYLPHTITEEPSSLVWTLYSVPSLSRNSTR